ncbi:MAG: CPCC family cysteine-rich protein [Butyricicoccus sp.]
MNEMKKNNCPCCGQTVVEEYDICNECGWENDPIQREKPDFRGGANRMSLKEARAAYAAGKPVE